MFVAAERATPDLLAVHEFYVALLRDVLGHDIPVPQQLWSAEAAPAERQAWLNLLDLAITPHMLRERLQSPRRPLLEALLRYYAAKLTSNRAQVDHLDLVVALLYRDFETAPRDLPRAERVRSFQSQLERVLEGNGCELPESIRPLLREFNCVREEALEFRDFDQLIDSGIIRRIRDLKRRLGPSFSHPAVLAVVAEYNAFFRGRFDELFRQAVWEIKDFARGLQQQGGSMLSPIEGEIRVQQLVEVQEEAILQLDYDRAGDALHKVSVYKKAVTRKQRGTREKPPARTAGPSPAPAGPAATPARLAVECLAVEYPGSEIPAERGKVRAAYQAIRSLVRSADPENCRLIRLRNQNLVLSQAEIDAFRADFAGEKSFRADCAAALAQGVALQLRIREELDAFAARRDSRYLWKPHADSLARLLAVVQCALQWDTQLFETAKQRGLQDKIEALTASMEKLNRTSRSVTELLQRLPAN